MEKILLLIVIWFFMTGCDSRSDDIAEVRVLDSKFKVIKTVKKPEKLKELALLWAGKKEAPRGISAKFSYKFDIVTDEGISARWLYDPSGYVLRLTKMKTPLYEITEKEKFKELLLP